VKDPIQKMSLFLKAVHAFSLLILNGDDEQLPDLSQRFLEAFAIPFALLDWVAIYQISYFIINNFFIFI
jgi:hypothetical protein